MPDYRLGKHRGRYAVVWTDESGNRQRRSLGIPLGKENLGLAQSALGKFARDLETAAKGPLTVGAIFEAYITDRRCELDSVERIESAWKALEPYYGHLMPTGVTKATNLEYQNLRRSDGVGDGTIWTEMTYLRSALGFAVKEAWLTQAPHVHVPQKPAPSEHYLSKPEARRLLRAAHAPHIELYITLLLCTAGRGKHILELTWPRVDFERRRVSLRDPSKPETRKGRAVVPMNDTLFAALTHAKEHATSPYVIEWGGGRVASCKKGLAAAAKRANVKASARTLRHTAAVWMAGAGVPMAKIAQYLGHNDSRTTERVYARYAPDFMADAAEAVEL